MFQVKIFAYFFPFRAIFDHFSNTIYYTVKNNKVHPASILGFYLSGPK